MTAHCESRGKYVLGETEGGSLIVSEIGYPSSKP